MGSKDKSSALGTRLMPYLAILAVISEDRHLQSAVNEHKEIFPRFALLKNTFTGFDGNPFEWGL